MQVKLSLKQRVMLKSILPEKGTKIEMILSESIYDKLEITTEEISKFEIKDIIHEGIQGFTWNAEGEKSIISIDFLDVEIEMIQKALKVIGETENYNKEFLKIEKLLGIF